jgi:acetylornithine deacetylase/succinyl-diaminopimelate desuccinylase-like protein
MEEELRDEAAEVLSRLISFRTVNPPGDERACQEWLAGYLDDAGLDVEMHGAEDGRPNLVARLRGRADGPTLGYLSHVDTVLADPGDWSVDPWSGEVRDGFLWGRGALDMKSQTAAEAVAAARIAREGGLESGELKVISVADEEVGGTVGAQWLTEERPDAARVDYLLNEGGGSVIPLSGNRFYGVCCAEKGTFRFTVRTRGTAGHASVPGVADNALLKLAPVIERLGAGRPRPDVTDEPRALLEAIGEDPSDVDAALERLQAAEPRLAAMFDPMLRITLAPTIVSAGEKINVIPARAEVRVDCRTPPGMGAEATLERVHEVLDGLDGLEVEFTEQVIGNRSPLRSELMDAIAGWVAERDPGARAVPVMLPAFTDSRWFRAAFPDCVAYGFFPHRHMTLYDTWPLIHGADERIDVRDLGYATAFFHDLPGRLLH